LLFLALDRYHLLLALLTALFFFTDTAPPEIYTLSLHDALPILTEGHVAFWQGAALAYGVVTLYVLFGGAAAVGWTNVFEGMIMIDRKSTRLNSSHVKISYAVFCLKKKKK